MASSLSARVFRTLWQTPCPKQPNPSYLRVVSRAYSAEAPPPPLLAKLKGDLKTAMRAKDATRLAVLRSILAATLNASKTASPITTDIQLVALLRKTGRQCKEAAAEFQAAGRPELVEKEEAQLRVLEEYAAGSGVESVSEAQIQEAATAALASIAAENPDAKINMTEVMKRVLGPGGPLNGKDVEKNEVAKIVKEMMNKA
ncbi:Yqey-like protein-domain-containing protein [Bombardia bombarda]|uniref:Altered inheritance of mitochondria protein 41 n=1 Tax=Bombardia bombarda TaxID=252184 RepID=A0AA39XPX9_9PEZI|nr:Yqey-like protein-domain-containing protein [Bombardia bombarda]